MKDRFHRGTMLAAGGLIALAGWLAYGDTMSVPFVFDDIRAIVLNPSIRHLWPIQGVMFPTGAQISAVTARPLLNLSFAINYAFGGLHVGGYHVVNLVIHILAGWTLFGIVRRTMAARGREATVVALAVAVLWLVHPLLTESVTYVSNRGESMMGLFYLLTVYGFIRFSENESLAASATSEVAVDLRATEIPPAGPFAVARRSTATWAVVSVLACLLGMATKETMVTAPVLVLLYDRLFCAGSLAEIWKRRRGYYFALAGTWLLLAFLVLREGGSRGEAAGFGLGMSSWTYALTQCWVVVHYLRLAIWPHPLVLDYGSDVIRNAPDVALEAAFLLCLGVGSIWAMFWRRPSFGRRVAGFLGACFFLILAPSSSVVPLVAATAAEHRMYLPLAAVVALAVAGIYRLGGLRGLGATVLLACACLAGTYDRNQTYRNTVALLRDAATQRPGNARVQNNLGVALFDTGQPAEAEARYRVAIQLWPAYADAWHNLGDVLYALGRYDDALGAYRGALALDPDRASNHDGLGSALRQTGRANEALVQFREAIGLDPNDAEAHNNLGSILGNQGRLVEAAGEFAEAVRLNPDYIDARRNLALARQALHLRAAP